MRSRSFDLGSFALILTLTVIGLAWATYNLMLAGLVRNETTVRPLVWAVCATPMALFLGWLIARPREIGLASACCFCLYFFSFFVAQRIESLLVTPDQAAANGHSTYFWAMICLHALIGGGLAIWRALAPPARFG